MAIFPRGSLVLMSGFPYYDEATKAVVHPPAAAQQPNDFDDRLPPDGHRGLPVFDGWAVLAWEPPVEAVPPAAAYAPLTPPNLIALIVSVIGAAAWRAARLDTAAEHAEFIVVRDMFDVAGDIARDDPKTAQGFGAFIAAGHMTTEQRDAILAAWPTV